MNDLTLIGLLIVLSIFAAIAMAYITREFRYLRRTTKDERQHDALITHDDDMDDKQWLMPRKGGDWSSWIPSLLIVAVLIGGWFYMSL